MLLYAIKRIILIIPVVLVVAILIYTLMNFVRGDPATLMAGGEVVTEEQLSVIRESMGLNKPFLTRLGLYLYNVVIRGDFGLSYTDGTPIGPELLARLWTTLRVAVLSLALMILIGVPLGIRAAVRVNTVEDRISMVVTMIGNSMPIFWLTLLLVLLFSLRLRWLPSYGSDTWKHFILPPVCVALEGMGSIARQTRSSMLEVIRSDYVTTAWSKGLPERKIIYEHALPNALIPIITVIGSQFGRLIGGVVVVERVLNIRGISTYLLNGIFKRDYPVVTGCLIVIAIMFSIIMLAADLFYTSLDPQIKAQYVIKKESDMHETEET